MSVPAYSAEVSVLPFGAELPQRTEMLARLGMQGCAEAPDISPTGSDGAMLIPFGTEQFVPLQPIEAGKNDDTPTETVRNISDTRLSNGKLVQDITTHTLT